MHIPNTLSLTSARNYSKQKKDWNRLHWYCGFYKNCNPNRFSKFILHTQLGTMPSQPCNSQWGRQLWNAMWPEDPMHTWTQTPSRVWEKRFPFLSFLSQRKTTLLLFVKFDIVLGRQKYLGSILLSGKLPTYPSPKPSFCPKWKVSVKLNVSLGEGYVGSFPEI